MCSKAHNIEDRRRNITLVRKVEKTVSSLVM